MTLLAKNKYSIQARRGYLRAAARRNPEELPRARYRGRLFSQEEQHGLPVALQTQFYKTDATDAKLAVLAHVDLAHLRFEKSGGRNDNDLTVVAALFDRNGNFVTGTQRVVS